MPTEVVTEQYLASLLADRWDQACRKIADLGEAIPAEDFEKAPVAGIRTCSAVLRHVAFWNRYVADSLAGRAPDDSGNELSAADYRDKQSITGELVRSSREAGDVLRTHPGAMSPKTAELMMAFIEHTSEHYGQLAVYARLLGIVPPASRTSGS